MYKRPPFRRGPTVSAVTTSTAATYGQCGTPRLVDTELTVSTPTEQSTDATPANDAHGRVQPPDGADAHRSEPVPGTPDPALIVSCPPHGIMKRNRAGFRNRARTILRRWERQPPGSLYPMVTSPHPSQVSRDHTSPAVSSVGSHRRARVAGHGRSGPRSVLSPCRIPPDHAGFPVSGGESVDG